MQFNKSLDNIKVYEAGKPIELVVREFGIKPEDVIKLASNENPLGTNPKVAEAICANSNRAYLYPDDSMFELKESLARRFDVGEENIIIGAGSDQILEFISRAKLNESSKVLMSQVTFAMYSIYAIEQGAKVVRTADYHHSSKEFIELMKEQKPEVVYICTPNNPTGDATDPKEILEIIKASDPNTLVVIDGAYMEYAIAKDPNYAIYPKDLIGYSNVIYLGTFSKAYGLGGMRVGYGIANSEIIQALMKMRPPFNITTLSLVSAIVANEDEEFVKRSLKLHFQELPRYEEYAKSHNFEFIDSYTNFITWLFPKELNSSKIANELLRRGVIVRDLSSYSMNALRITVGTPKQNDRLFEVMDEVLG